MIVAIACASARADNYDTMMPHIGDSKQAALIKIGSVPVSEKAAGWMGMRVEVLEFRRGLWTTRIAVVLGRVVTVDAREGLSIELFQ